MSRFQVDLGGVRADAVGAAGGVVVGRVAAGRGEGVASGSGGAGPGAVGPRADDGAVGALAPRGHRHGSCRVDRRATDDRDGDLRAVDGLEGALSVGVPDVDGGGLGLDPLAPVLPDLAVGASAGRLDGAQADAACRGRDGERVDPVADRGRGAPEAVAPAGGEDRFDRRRWRRTCAIRPTRTSPRTGSGCSPGRAASSPRW